MKNYIISGQVDTYRVKVNLFEASPNSAINIFKQKYPKAEDILLPKISLKKDNLNPNFQVALGR